MSLKEMFENRIKREQRGSKMLSRYSVNQDEKSWKKDATLQFKKNVLYYKVGF